MKTQLFSEKYKVSTLQCAKCSTFSVEDEFIIEVNCCTTKECEYCKRNSTNISERTWCSEQLVKFRDFL